MGKRFAYFTTVFLGVVLAVLMELAVAPSVTIGAQRNSGGHPTPECQACAQACETQFEECKATNGEEKSAFGKCAEKLEQCGAACRRPGGACNPQTQPPSR
jgi:hypothetical protein